MTGYPSTLKSSGLKIADVEAVAAYLDGVNGRAGAFTASVVELQRSARSAEERLDAANLPQAKRVGITLRYRTAGPSAKAYKYAVVGNEAEFKRFREGSRLMSVVKVGVHPREKAALKLSVTTGVANEIMARAVNDLRIIPCDMESTVVAAERTMPRDEQNCQIDLPEVEKLK